MKATTEAKRALCVFEALRRMGWPSGAIYFINGTDSKTQRHAAYVTLQVDAQSAPMLACRFAFLDETPDALTNLQANITRWNTDPAFRADVWDKRARYGFDDIAFMFVLVNKGLDIGPERAQ